MDEHETQPDSSTVETLQSLIVAFVLAMTFRGFVTEGFVIPTGSMAPTLMGRHLLLRSPQTGYRYRLDAKYVQDDREKGLLSKTYPLQDPMLGPDDTIASPTVKALPRTRLGDRVLVLKCLYPFSEPDRFDVVVFKNPTNPDSDAENYIKRLIGLPGEAIWLVDGDVFVASADDPKSYDTYRIQRKPEYVQRAVWQPLHNSDYIPIDPARLRDLTARRYQPPWTGDDWTTRGVRRYRCEKAGPTVLQWDPQQIPPSDLTIYNMASFSRKLTHYPVSDLRVSAGIVADREGLSVTLHIEARHHLFTFSIADGTATMRMQPLDGSGGRTVEQTAEVAGPQPGRGYDVEFWHVDQSMLTFVNGRRVGQRLEYDWTPTRRIEEAFHPLSFEQWQTKKGSPMIMPTTTPQIRLRFSGSPLTIHRLRVDRDLYYRPARLSRQKNPPRHQGPAFGTHPDNIALLGPDHFFMLGDNSPASSDSRLWGSPHPLVKRQIDDTAFLVNRKLLLGKAWVVYFPAPYPLTARGRGVIPDFGRLRFIR